MATIRRDHYSLLGVPPTAEPPEIRRAFKQRAIERHPDHAGAQAAGEFRDLSDAYHVLTDPSRRAAYDAELRRREPGPRGPVLDLRSGPPRRHGFPDDDAPSDLFEAMFDRLFRAAVDQLDELRLSARTGLERRSPDTSWSGGLVRDRPALRFWICGRSHRG